MNNPFSALDELNTRLLNIESLLLSLKNTQSAAPPKPQIEIPISQRELCAFLKVTPQTIIRWKKKKKIPFIQLGTIPRYNLSEVLKALGK